MKRVYVASPFSSDEFETVNKHKRYARELGRECIINGYDIEAVHLFYPQMLKDNDPIERALGMTLAIEKLKECDMLLVGQKFGISSGVESEIAIARSHNMKIAYVDDVNKVKDALSVLK